MNHLPKACPGSGLKATSPKRVRPRLRFRVLDLGIVEGNNNMIHAINNAGDLVGAALASGRNVEAFVSHGRKRLLGTLGGAFSAAHGVNNAGQVVGGALTTNNEQFHAFLFTGNTMYDLNDLVVGAPGWELVQAVGINDRGQIVGVGLLDGEDHVFLLQPARSTRRRGPSRPPPV